MLWVIHVDRARLFSEDLFTSLCEPEQAMESISAGNRRWIHHHARDKSVPSNQATPISILKVWQLHPALGSRPAPRSVAWHVLKFHPSMSLLRNPYEMGIFNKSWLHLFSQQFSGWWLAWDALGNMLSTTDMSILLWIFKIKTELGKEGRISEVLLASVYTSHHSGPYLVLPIHFPLPIPDNQSQSSYNGCCCPTPLLSGSGCTWSMVLTFWNGCKMHCAPRTCIQIA